MNKKPTRNVLQGPLMYLLILAIILLMVHMLRDRKSTRLNSSHAR